MASEKVSRRDFLKYTATAVVAGVIGGVGGYLAGKSGAKSGGAAVTKTVTVTTTKTLTQTLKSKKPSGASIPSKPIKLAIVTFLTGVAAAPFGIPAKNAFEMLIEEINAAGGIAGRKIDVKFYDESGGLDAQVKLARKLALEDKVDAIIGYISSSHCKAIVPLADELGVPIIAFDCGTHVLMEGNTCNYSVPKYKLGFRTCAHLALDNVALAYYIKENFPNVKRIAGINPDYAWGRDSWKIFKMAIKKLMPDVEIVAELWPKLFTTDFTPHITALLKAKPDIIHTSLWGGDGVTFTKQALSMGLFKRSRVAYSRGDLFPMEIGKSFPEGQIINAAGPHYYLWPPHDKWPMNKEFVEKYMKRYGKPPVYPSYHAAQAILMYKAALEKAVALLGKWPDPDEFAKAMEGLVVETPSGHVMMARDHNAVEETTVVGVTKYVPSVEPKFPILTNIKNYPAVLLEPPTGIKTECWINSWKT